MRVSTGEIVVFSARENSAVIAAVMRVTCMFGVYAAFKSRSSLQSWDGPSTKEMRVRHPVRMRGERGTRDRRIIIASTRIAGNNRMLVG